MQRSCPIYDIHARRRLMIKRAELVVKLKKSAAEALAFVFFTTIAMVPMIFKAYTVGSNNLQKALLAAVGGFWLVEMIMLVIFLVQLRLAKREVKNA